MSPVNQDGKLTGPLSVFNGVTAYGTSAKGGTRAAYDAVCRDMFGGPLNMRRAYSGLPEPTDSPTLWSSKQYSEQAMTDAAAAFAAYGKPSLFTHHHEPNPETSPADWQTRNAAWRSHLPSSVATGAIFMRQDAADGSLARYLPSRPPWLTWLGFDTYSLDVVKGMTPAQLFAPCASEAARLGVPFGFGEFNLAGPAEARNEWFDEAIRWWCANRHVLFVLNFQSNVGDPDRVPTNYDGSIEWNAAKASDRANPEIPEKWRSLSHLTRTQAAASGSTVGF